MRQVVLLLLLTGTAQAQEWVDVEGYKLPSYEQCRFNHDFADRRAIVLHGMMSVGGGCYHHKFKAEHDYYRNLAMIWVAAQNLRNPRLVAGSFTYDLALKRLDELVGGGELIWP